MYQIDFNRPEAVHFIGIGGISMSGLAEILIDRGFRISGSDILKSSLTEHLAVKGANIVYGQHPDNIAEDCQVVVYTAAVHADNPEFKAAGEKGIPMLTRAELLGQIMKNYEHSIAVSGTHGKTTTTSMIAEILLAADADPTISVGGILNSISGNIRVGKSGLFVTEACEYTNSFLSFFPTLGVILNIDEDHLDFFKDLSDIRHSFRLFARKLPADGVLMIGSDIQDYEGIISGLPCKVMTFGRKEGSNYRAEHIEYDEFARATFSLRINGGQEDRITLGVPGEHNVSNALAAIGVCMELGIDPESIKKGLKKFSGTNRRFEIKGNLGGVTVIDDYAHHPQEIRATISTARNYPHRKLWVVFQPHTYTRTKAFLDEFSEVLAMADEVVLADIYAARETDRLGISSKDIVNKIEQSGTKAHYIPSFDEIETFILENCVNGDLLITMGAGDIVKVGEKLLGL